MFVALVRITSVCGVGYDDQCCGVGCGDRCLWCWLW